MNNRVSASANDKKGYVFQPFVIRKHKPRNVRNGKQIPFPRSGHRIVADDEYCYSFGGFNPQRPDGDPDLSLTDDHYSSQNLFKEIWRFNLSTETWDELTCFEKSMPDELASNAVVLTGHTMVVHGGTGVPFGTACSNETYITNLQSCTSFLLLQTCGPKPPKHYGQAMILEDQDLYVVGGTTGFTYSSDVYKLDLSTNKWEALFINDKLGKGPEGRYRHEIALYNDKIYVFGGGTATHVFDLEKLPVFDLKTRTWNVVNTTPDIICKGRRNGFPEPRRCHSHAQVVETTLQPPELFICGGYNGRKLFNDVWKINLNTLQWTCCKSELGQKTYFHSSCVSPSGRMLTFGGVVSSSAGHVRVNDMYSCWVTIPKLSDMSWDALMHYAPNITHFSKAALLKSGIPAKFVTRLE